jgi:hypothetical protein
MTADQYRQAHFWTNEAVNALVSALSALDSRPESATADEQILQGIILQLANIRDSYKVRSLSANL